MALIIEKDQAYEIKREINEDIQNEMAEAVEEIETSICVRRCREFFFILGEVIKYLRNVIETIRYSKF